MSSRRNKIIAAILIAITTVRLSVAQEPTQKSHVRAKLLADVKSIEPGKPFTVGVRLEMDPGWHTYWVNPGEAGLATKVQWHAPEGIDIDSLRWPAPKLINAGSVVSYGYEGRVLLTAPVKTSTDLSVFDPAVLRARVDWMECADICVPGGADITLELPVKIQPPAANESVREDFAQAQAALPATESSWRISLVNMPTEWRLMFRPPVGSPCLDKKVTFFPDRAGLVVPSAPQKWEWVGDGCRLIMKKVSLTAQKNFSGLVMRADGWDASGSQRALQVNLPVQ